MTFRGTIPCADCPGIELTVTLLPDGTFRLRQRYLDRDPLTTWLDLGRWTEEDGGRLALRGVGEGPVWFARFGWDSLRVLDGERRELPSDLPSGLRRAGEVDPVHDVQPLEGMVARSAAGAMIFAECRTGVAFPVSMEGAYAELERAFWKGSAAAEPLLVRVRGSLLGGPAEGDPGATSLVVEAVEGAFPGAGCAETVSDLPLEGTEWLLLELAGSPLPAGIVATLLLDGTDGQATGSGGCNSFVGRYGLHGARLTFANLAIAARACTSPTKDMEEAYLRTLARVGGYRLMGADLQLLAEEGVVARFRSR
jgi:heat shock protein HslJ